MVATVGRGEGLPTPLGLSEGDADATIPGGDVSITGAAVGFDVGLVTIVGVRVTLCVGGLVGLVDVGIAGGFVAVGVAGEGVGPVGRLVGVAIGEGVG